ncbi:serine/threonine protein kinase [Calothrix sp. NIES-4071]|nr:serine/threonine protein kinase [Calothrix sp. NIES-4071]BAZ61323.1 serine/threonine protein kinase [Calothrix sp. NIES-4105]
MIGQLLAGHYKVLKVLGEGGFGQTYIVEDIHLPGHPQCVLKHLKPTCTDPQALETSRRLFQREASCLQQLGNYDQIPRLLAYFEENQEFYLVLQLIVGHTLTHELIPGQRWTEGQVISMLQEVLKILEVVHEQGVIHRDIKPDNIIRRNEDQKLVLIDFGAIKQVRSLTSASHQQRVTVTVGTPGYMPSEQIRRLPRPSSDIYALGMMGIQALTGVNPRSLQDDPNTGETLWQHLVPVTPGLATVLEKMTRYHFKDRYQTAKEVSDALTELLTQVSAPTVTPMAPPPSVQADYLQELTLSWHENGELRSCTIEENPSSKNQSRIKIGRDPQVCDVVIPDISVSGLHAEIFFDTAKQKFYLRNLRQQNPPIVDGKLLLAGEMPLTNFSSIRLGRQQLKVSAITKKQVPIDYSLISQSSNQPDLVRADNIDISNSNTNISYTPEISQKPVSEPVTKTAPPQKLIYTAAKRVSPSAPPVISSIPKRKPLILGMSMAAVISTVGGLVCLRAGSTGKNYSEQSFISQQPKLCRVIAPTGGNFVAKLRPEPQTEVGAIKQLNPGEKVLFMQVKGDFVQVRLADGTQGWIFSDQMQRCDTLHGKS